jgi:membrane-associated protease RseP (regulator of RpoE activity)
MVVDKKDKKMTARLPMYVYALALTTGCASSGTQLRDSQVMQFEAGVTTDDDVLHALGPPTGISSSSDGSEILIYTGSHAMVKAANFIPIVGLSASGATPEPTAVAFHFGPDYRLSNYEITHGKSAVIMGGAHTENSTVTDAQSNPDSPSAPQASGISEPSHVRLGVHCTQLTATLAERYHLPSDVGVQVETIEAESVAEAAGIRVGDVILKYGDHPLKVISDLTAAIASTTPGADVPITVWRRTVGESVVQAQF